MTTPEDYHDPASAVVEPRQSAAGRRRILLAGTIGTAIEWYDFFIYGLIAPLVFDQLFFPKFDQLTATIAVFATFAVGFLARPPGGLVFGHFGDRLGRRSVLLCTLLMMGFATMSIGLLPTYGTAGIAATVALVVLRFIQGFALGGESTAAILMALETSPGHRRGFSAAMIQAAGPVGVVLASFAALAISRLPEADLLSWGWRVPFLISAVLVILGIYMRLRIEESATFREVGEVEAVPAIEAIRTHWRPILIVFFAEMAQTSYFYLTAIFTISFATRQLGVQKDVIAQAVLFANLVALVAMPLIVDKRRTLTPSASNIDPTRDEHSADGSRASSVLAGVHLRRRSGANRAPNNNARACHFNQKRDGAAKTPIFWAKRSI